MKKNIFCSIIVFVFLSGIVKVSQAQWSQIGSNIIGEAAGDCYGHSISIDSSGTVIAIGAPENFGSDSASGHVRVFEYNGSSWVQKGSDIDGEAACDYSGYSVSLSADGNIVAIGAPLNDGNTEFNGHVRVFQYNGSAWIQMGNDIDGDSLENGLGEAVSLSNDGKIVAIGASSNDVNSGNIYNNTGHVLVYQYSGSSWVQIGNDIEGEAPGDYFGRAVDINSDGTIVAIGAPNNDGNGNRSGHVRVYQYNGTTWAQMGCDIDGENEDDHSGQYLSLNADGYTVAIGAPNNDGNGTRSGHVRIYNYINSTWTQVGADIDGDAYSSSSVVSLSADGMIVAIGGSMSNGNGTQSGQIKIFKYLNNSWTQVGNDIYGEEAGDRAGNCVSLNADGSVVGCASVDNIPLNFESGHVRVFGNTTIGIPINIMDQKVNVFPNPANDFINISIAEEIDGSMLWVRDCFGRIIIERKAENTMLLDISNLPSGIYLVQYYNQTMYFVKQ